MSDGFLFAVAAEANVHRKLACLRELAGGREKHVERPLVVDCAAAIDIAVTDLGLEGVAFPQLERVWRRHIEMPIAEDRRRVATVRCAYFPDRERLAVPVDEFALTARLAHPRADPLARTFDIVSMCGVAADRL